VNTPDPQDYNPIAAGDAGNTSPTGIPNTTNPTALTNTAYGFLEQFEGIQGLAYPDGNGYAAVGVGELLKKKPISGRSNKVDSSLRPAIRISSFEALAALKMFQC